MVRKCVVCDNRFGKDVKRSFHRFPRDMERRNLWVSILNGQNWSITNNTFICSDHFADIDFMVKPSGIRYLRRTAVPVIPNNSQSGPEVRPIESFGISVDANEDGNKENIYSDVCHSSVLNMSTSPSKSTSSTLTASETALQMEIFTSTSTRSEEIIVESSPLVTKVEREKRKRRLPRYLGECHTSDMDSPKRAKQNWSIAKKKVLTQSKKIRNLQQTKRRLKSRISSLNSLLKFLKEKYHINDSAEAVIRASVPGSFGEILSRLSKGPSRQKYTPQLRAFALTLSFYSMEAYNYVRNTFKKSLPHPTTISKWFRSVDGTPGFTSEAISALKMKTTEAASRGQKVLCNLVMDEMAIMQRVEWNGKRFTGYVDLGRETYGDLIPEAKEALVFMVVALNGHWKLTLGYFLTDGLNGSEKANLVKKCLEFVHETEIVITSLTFDGAPSNLNMAKELGANFDNPSCLKTFFLNPFTNEEIYILLDICHMLKLIRNCLASSGILQDQEDKPILWQYFIELVKLQNVEGLQAATKLKKRHLDWFREKMKVRLAAQTFSNGVADALLYLSEDLKLPNFKDAAATAEFVKIFNNLFDIFNTHNKFSKGEYKKAICLDNATSTFAYLDYCANYIKTLTLEGQSVLKIKRKTGFLGFLICISSLKGIYKKYMIDSQSLNFICTYKLSQDHLELFFSAVRNKGGNNNNPTARQFEHIYKRLLVHTEIKGSENANAIAIDNTSILYVTSVTKTVSGEELQNSEEYKKLCSTVNQMEFLNSSYWHLTAYAGDVIAYISGFVVKCLKKCVSCVKCLSVLESNETFSLLQQRKCYGALINASPVVINICRNGEKCLKVLVNNFSIFNIPNVKDILINRTLRTLSSETFNCFADHIFDGEPLNNHCMQLTKLILSKYFEIRIHHETSRLKDLYQARIRSKLTKAILFQNQ